jgi:hypothetical protein
LVLRSGNYPTGNFLQLPHTRNSTRSK